MGTPLSITWELVMANVVYVPIGIVRSPFKTVEGTPIQPVGAKGVRGQIELREEFVAGVKDLEGFSHLILIYHFHLSNDFDLRVKPFLDSEYRGVFATRAPKRPNPIGISVVRLVKIDGRYLTIEDVDVVDGTPLLDIKPYVPQFDSIKTGEIGWLSGRVQDAEKSRADDRFK
jgi:tRNA-Thr(GGU) m(6)t(6)A37 methyltransferase TsaA